MAAVDGDAITVRQADGSLRRILWATGNASIDNSLSMALPGTKLHLLDVTDNGSILAPQYVIAEPDYLVDVSSLAECCQPYGFLWQLYFYNRLRPRRITRHILLGNAANLMLDELVNADAPENISPTDLLKNFFSSAALELSVCDGIDKSFFDDLNLHLRNLLRVVTRDFNEARLHRREGMIEPSFISPLLGLRGRLDFLQIAAGKAAGIELKSGKNADGYIAQTHKVQLSLYQMMLCYALSVESPDFYALYSRYPQGNLIKSHLSPALMQQVFGLRNRIVMEELLVANGHPDCMGRLIDAFRNPVYNLPNHPLVKYIGADLAEAADCLDAKGANSIETAYFNRFYRFVSRELHLSKVARAASEREGITTLWQCSQAEKQAMGCIIAPVTLLQNHAGDDNPLLSFSFSSGNDCIAPNFREGDMALLYRYDDKNCNVTNRPVFRAVLVSISSHQVVLQLRDRQRGLSVFSVGQTYAVEPDYSDAAFTLQFRNLFAFLKAPAARRQLLIGTGIYRPRIGTPAQLAYKYESPEIEQIISRAVGDGDLYLLLGPPGTGKTSTALLGMVREIAARPDSNLLLVAYTNRAVDEICEKLEPFPDLDYIRIGMEQSCDRAYRHRLLSNRLNGISKRDSVKSVLASCRIYVASLVSLLSKPELFKIKHFDTAIIDEASQLLEPQLLGLFAATDDFGKPSIARFVLIGDHKQLPAIVLQDRAASQVNEPLLNECGLTDCRMSLFERLYRRYEAFPQLTGMLSQQWRMHPDIADFASQAFYGCRLRHGNAPHQQAILPFTIFCRTSVEESLLATFRLAFIDVKPSEESPAKSNSREAVQAARLVAAYYKLHERNGLAFSPDKAIGIITPYRNQIAAIRQELEKFNLRDSEKIRIDTVERFQGSQNDFIIFSCAVSNPAQMAFLSAYSVEEGFPIDRKLNVAMTRARCQMAVIGHKDLLETNPIYKALIRYIGQRGSIITNS